ncbi:hypothetical protein Q4524_07415 [Alteromonas stellipolaris]|uniref:hypothetical protein n=1 Tax=Alteromonas stellipolaris TaxID=233316 RepID=UPI0026E16D29|nr:hypothetical protein [Alteromonas stellipolaris]MDO6538408.1 hypothetical protein [Alteromonas stellipolaris]
MNDPITVDEARSMSGFYSITGSRLCSMAFRAIRNGADKEKKTSVTIDIERYKLQKYSVREAREALEDKGFTVETSENKGLVKFNVSWFLEIDKDMKLLF